jgi:membrane dipeptidase
MFWEQHCCLPLNPKTDVRRWTVADGTHCGARTALDIRAATTAPMVYSHSCMRAVRDHPRNITDEQARECAAAGDVIADHRSRHLSRCQRRNRRTRGPEHVGVGSDFPFDHADLNREPSTNPQLFPESFRRWGPIEFVAPEPLGRLGSALSERGYPPAAVNAVRGGNFLRVARQVWPG